MNLNIFKKKLKCKICGAEFPTQDGLNTHATTHSQQPAGQSATQEAKPAEFRCPICNVTLPSEAELKEHAQTHAQPGQQSGN
jgi:transcription elongation factor Elf1